MKTITPYGADGKVFADMSGMLTLATDENMSDILGEIYMESGCGNKNTGQFFYAVPSFGGNSGYGAGRNGTERNHHTE